MNPDERTPEALPLAEEKLVVEKRPVDLGRVKVRTSVEEDEVTVREELLREAVSVERVPVGREVVEAPDIRREGDVLIVPVVEERLVVEKRLVVTEELHIRTERTREPFEQPVTLRRTQATVEREEPPQKENRRPQ